jgi:hypothetical protein
MTKPIPKSLHTVRVLVIVARLIIATDLAGRGYYLEDTRRLSAEDAIASALSALGYAPGHPDQHGIAAGALKAWKAGL